MYFDVTQEPIIAIRHLTESVDNDNNGFPESFQLTSVYPNPFNSIFTVSYNLNSRASVDLRLYSINGIEVWSSSGTMQIAGQYQVTVDCSGLASGIYLLSLRSGSAVESRKIILIQ